MTNQFDYVHALGGWYDKQGWLYWEPNRTSAQIPTYFEFHQIDLHCKNPLHAHCNHALRESELRIREAEGD